MAVDSTSISVVSGLQQDARVNDYLNDKIQITADLANIDVLLRDVQSQQDLLQEQLEAARQSLNTTNDAAHDFDDGMQTRLDRFNRKQVDIDRRLRAISQSDSSDEAFQQFSSVLEKVERLDIAQQYVALLAEVDRLRDETRYRTDSATGNALQPYLRLQQIATALGDAQPHADGAAVHLVDHVEHISGETWRYMKDAHARDLEGSLKNMGWPRPDVTFTNNLEQQWSSSVRKLLAIQLPHLQALIGSEGSFVGQAPVLLPLEIMIRPLEYRFKYHFEGDRPTNKLDKPEYFLSHVIDLLSAYDDFFEQFLQPLLLESFGNSSLSLISICIDSTSALITASLPMLRRKILSSMATVAQRPQILSHWVHELMSFDTHVREEWLYDGGNGVHGWQGLTWDVLNKEGWFSRWLEVEKNFAISRYETIIEAPEAFEIDRDTEYENTSKPTYAATRVNDLLEAVTDRYKSLLDLSQKMQFLIHIQITIFENFHDRLSESLRLYQSLSTSLGRNLQGATAETKAEIQGLGGLERLCRIYGSAEYLEMKMHDWSDDIFFIALWDDLQDRAQAKATDQNLAAHMTAVQIAERTSAAVGSDENTGALFDEMANIYRRLRTKTEQVLEERMVENLREALRPYAAVTIWSSISGPDLQAASASTAELDAFFQYVNSNLSFLSKVLSPASLRRLGRQLTLATQKFLWDRILCYHRFSEQGVGQFKRDVEIIWATYDEWLGKGQAERGMGRLKEALLILDLPDGANINDDDRDQGSYLAFTEVERRLFRDNENAREVLEDMGVERLTVSEARDILQRKVEAGIA